MTSAEWEAVRLSLQVASASVAVSLLPAIAVGWVLARKRFLGKAIIETAVNLPLVLPPVVTGYLLLTAFGQRGWLGRALNDWFGLRLVFDWKGAALAAAVVSFPLMVRAVRVAFMSVDRRLEQTARSLGAGRRRVFLTVSLPLARHGVVAGCVLAFARSLGEFGATIMIAGNIPGQTRTIPLYVYDQLQTPNGIEHSFALILFSVAIAAAALLLAEWFDRRSAKPIATT